MTADLKTYLRDHMAGASAALELIHLMRGHSEIPALNRLLEALLQEVQEDEVTLRTIAHSVGADSSSIKESAAWLNAQFASVKVRAGGTSFGAFEGLEFLALGILGKLQLWEALQRSPSFSDAPCKPDLASLIRRAEEQHRKVDELRLVLAATAL